MEPQHIGRYRVLSALGAGAMGEVLRARDERLGRDVAIKRVKNVFGAMTSLFNARFEAEARALAALAHPGVVQVFDLGIDGEAPYLVMELVEGPSLRTVLNEQGPLSPPGARALGIQLARALEAAHGRGILHRDIKPANVLQAPGGVWKLADFGVARVPDSEMTIAGQFIGTPAYAAPEAITLGQFSPASDVFGLATTIVEAVTGAKPRRDATLAEMIARAGEPISLGDVPAELVAVLEPALASDPTRRPGAGAFAEMLAGSTVGASTVRAARAVETVAVADGPVGVPVGTVAVPEGTVAVPDQTAFTRSISSRRPAASSRPIALYVVAGVLGVGLLAAVASTCSDGAGPTPMPGRAPAAELDDERRDEERRHDESRDDEPQTFAAPPNMDRRAAHEWGKVAEEVHNGKLDHALKKLYEFEYRFGASEQSARLRAWLERAEGQERYEDW